MAPKARAKSIPKAKGKARPDASPKPKAKGKATASAKAAASAQAPAASSSSSSAPPVPPSPEPISSNTTATTAAETAVAPPPTAEPTPPLVTADTDKETPSTKCRRLEESTVDPWAALSDEEALAKVSNEAWDHILDNLQDCGACAGPAHIVLKDGNHKNVASSAELCAVAVSLDLSENAVEKVEVLPALWVRNLVLASNPLQSLDALADLFPRLVSLDLSFVDLPSLAGAWEALGQCRRLRSLVAESAGVSTFEDMSTMSSLETLELVENSLEELEEIEVLAARCPSLLRLDLRENPVVTEFGYAQAVKKHLPGLVWRDNQSLRKYVAKGVDKAGYENLNAEVNAVDGLYKNEHCSCLEGNPCIDPATCVDWEHREAVAAEARKRKGLRDESGKQL